MNGFCTVLGSIKIDVLGFDRQSNSIFFTRTDWSECDCQTELYIYRIDADTIEIVKDWCSRNKYATHRDEIVKSKGLTYLTKPDTLALPKFVKFNWEPEVKYYNKTMQKETIARPFKLSVFKTHYSYYQCWKSSGNPEFINMKVDADSGLILVKFQGDCFEGNWRDSLVYYSNRNGKNFTKKLTANDVDLNEIEYKNYKE